LVGQLIWKKRLSIFLTLMLLACMLMPAGAFGASITIAPDTLAEGYPNGQIIQVQGTDTNFGPSTVMAVYDGETDVTGSSTLSVTGQTYASISLAQGLSAGGMGSKGYSVVLATVPEVVKSTLTINSNQASGGGGIPNGGQQIGINCTLPAQGAIINGTSLAVSGTVTGAPDTFQVKILRMPNMEEVTVPGIDVNSIINGGFSFTIDLTQFGPSYLNAAQDQNQYELLLEVTQGISKASCPVAYFLVAAGATQPPGGGGATVSGYVYTPNNSESLNNTEIFFMSQSNVKNSVFGTVDPQARTYQVANVQPGSYSIKVFSPGGLFLEANDTELILDQGTATLTRNLHLSSGVSLSGRILGKKTADGSAEGLENVYLTLFDRLPPSVGGQPGSGATPNPAEVPGTFHAQSGDGGNFTISIPGNGRYYLSTMNPFGLLDKSPPASDLAYGGAGIEVVLSSVSSSVYEIRSAVGTSIGDIVLESMDAVAGAISLTATRNGQGVAGANVTVGNPGRLFFREAVTGQDGSVTLDKVPAGEGYIVNISYTDSQGAILTGGAKNVTVAAQATAALGTIALRAPNELPPGGTGRISGIASLLMPFDPASGHHPEPLPVSGVTVFLFNEKIMYGASAITDQNGAYEFTGLPDSDSYMISVWSPQGYTSPADPDATGISATIGENGREIVQDFWLHPPVGAAVARGSGISGTVTDAGTGAAIAGMVVVAGGSAGGGIASTDAGGRYVIDGLSSGEYAVTAQGSNADYQDFTRNSILVDKGAITPNVNFALKPVVVDRGKISGYVKNVSGQGLSGVEVSAWSSGKMVWSSAATDAQGAYSLDKLKVADDYEVNFVWQTGGQYLYETQRGIAVERDKTTTVNQTMDTGLTVSGKVVNDQGGGISDVQVNASATDSSHFAWAVTDSQGNFSLAQMKSSKTYSLNFYLNPALGYLVSPDAVPSSVSLGTSDVTLPDITLSRGLELAGTLADSQSQGLTGIDVYAYSPSTNSWSRARSDGNGFFTMKSLSQADDYVLSTFDKSHTYENAEMTGIQVAANTKPVTITLLKPSEKQGSFVGEGNFLKVSDVVTTPGKTLTYNIGYKNNGVAAVSGASVTAQIPSGTIYVDGSAAVNQVAVEPAVSGGNIAFSIPGSIPAGGKGTITYQVTVDAGSTATTVKNSAAINAGGSTTPLGSATTELAYATISGPSVTKDGKLTVYGNCSAGATVIIEATKSGEAVARRVGRATASGRWWSREIDLGSTETAYSITARVEMANGTVSTASSPLSVTVKSDTVTISSVKVNSGWNKDVTINPSLGVATMAVVENNDINIEVKFSDTVSNVKTHFIGREAALTDNGGNTWKGQVISGRWSSSGDQLIEVEYTYGGNTVRTPIVNVIILMDPSGFVYDGTFGSYDRFSATIEEDTENVRLSGVTALCEVNSQANGQGTWSKWNASAYGQVNPQVTDSQGRYGWDVPTGTYRVVFSKTGYKTVFSDVVAGVTVVPPPELKLHVGLISVTPQVTGRSPASGATGVAVGSAVTAEFSKNINQATLTGSFTLLQGNSPVPGSIAYDSNTRTATFTPSQNLSPGTQYTVNISAAVADGDGNGLPAAVSWNFTTAAAAGGAGNNSDGSSGGGPSTTDAVTRAIANAANKATITINAAGNLETSFTAAKLASLTGTGKPAAVQLKNATFTLPPAALEVPAVSGAASVQMSASQLDKVGSLVIFNQATNATGFMLAGEIYDLSITAVGADGKKTAVREFAKPIQVSLPVPEGQREAAVKGLIQVYRFNEATRSWESKGGAYDAQAGTITFSTSQFSKFALLAEKEAKPRTAVFSDLADHWAKVQVQYMADNGYVSGMGNGQFSPDASVTRAQFATMLASSLKLDGDAKAPFSDLQPGQWYYQAVVRAYGAGLIKGVGGSLFAPDEVITREQMASMICNALSYKGKLSDEPGIETLLAGFADQESISGWARSSAARAVKNGILKGKTAGGAMTFAPADAATRAEAVVMLKNMLDKLK